MGGGISEFALGVKQNFAFGGGGGVKRIRFRGKVKILSKKKSHTLNIMLCFTKVFSAKDQKLRYQEMPSMSTTIIEQ